MIKYQKANVNKDTCPKHILEYTYIGLKAELDEFNAGKKAQENEFWFCPDENKWYYWNKDAQQFLLLGTGYSPEPPPEPTKLATPEPDLDNGAITWDAIDNASGYSVNIYDGTNTRKGALLKSYNTSERSFACSIPEGEFTLIDTFFFEVIAKGDGTNYSDSDPSEAMSWDRALG